MIQPYKEMQNMIEANEAVEFLFVEKTASEIIKN
jgi:hypothetical protein